MDVSAQRLREAQAELEHWQGQQAFIFNPFGTLQRLSFLHSYVFVPFQFGPQDFFKTQSGTWMLRGTPTQQLGEAAGIEWAATQSGFLPVPDKQIIAYKAVGGIRRPDGTLGNMTSKTYQKDRGVIRNQIEERVYKASEDAQRKGGQPWSQDRITREIERRYAAEMVHVGTKTETGAQLRVIRAILGLSTFPNQQVHKQPFVVVKVQIHPDYADPEVKQAAIATAFTAGAAIFGGQLPQVPVRQLPEAIDVEHHTVEDEEPEPPQLTELSADQFAALEVDDMVKACEALRDLMQWDDSHLPFPISEFPHETRDPKRQLGRLYATLQERRAEPNGQA